MSYFIKQVKNTTESPIELHYPGVTVPASSTFDIESSEYELWALATEESPDSQLVTLVKSGDIIVRNGITDLSIAVGILHLKVGMSPVQVSADDETPDLLENKIVAGPGISISTIDSALDRHLEISGQSALDNDLDTVQFARQGNVSNNTVLLTLNNIVSDTSPDTMAYNVMFRRFSVSNSNLPPYFTLRLWKITADHSVSTMIYSEVFDYTTANWNYHSGYTQEDKNIVIGQGYGIWMDVVGVGNPKPADLSVFCWLRKYNGS